MCVEFTFTPLKPRGARLDLAGLAGACGLNLQPCGRNSFVITPRDGCGCDLVLNAGETTCAQWRLEPEAARALEVLAAKLGAVFSSVRFTCTWHGDEIKTERAVRPEEFVDLLRSGALANRSAYLIRAR